MKTINSFGWNVETIRNSKDIGVTDGNLSYKCNVLVQAITAPDGSKILVEQHIENDGEYQDILISRV
ncbi:MAG: hypothetical protein Q8O62_01860 [Aequorivita sp.]|nr:hypothetical protein [Aequorivita sp.]